HHGAGLRGGRRGEEKEIRVLALHLATRLQDVGFVHGGARRSAAGAVDVVIELLSALKWDSYGTVDEAFHLNDRRSEWDGDRVAVREQDVIGVFGIPHRRRQIDADAPYASLGAVKDNALRIRIAREAASASQEIGELVRLRLERVVARVQHLAAEVD